MTRDPQAKLKIGLLSAIAVLLFIGVGGFISIVLQAERGSETRRNGAIVEASSASQVMMATISRRLNTDRSWMATGSDATLTFGMAVYTVSGADRPDPTLTIDTSHAPPDVRSGVAGRAASVALAVANAPDRPVDQVEVSRALAERREDVRVVNGVEIAVAGDRLTLRQVAG